VDAVVEVWLAPIWVPVWVGFAVIRTVLHLAGAE
jgi:hypothetical protein